MDSALASTWTCSVLTVALPEGRIRADDFLDAIKFLDLRRMLALEIAEFLPKRNVERKTEKLIAEITGEIFFTKWRQQQ